MYPSQDEEEIEGAMKELGDKSRGLVAVVKRRLDRTHGEDDKRTACRSFLGKWEDRAQKEEAERKEKGLSVASLGHALPK